MSIIFFFKQKTAYELRISDWSSDVCSSDLVCKRPTATGEEGSDRRRYDIHPGDSADSIMEFRIGPTATTPAARMPPLARSVVDEEIGRASCRERVCQYV